MNKLVHKLLFVVLSLSMVLAACAPTTTATPAPAATDVPTVAATDTVPVATDTAVPAGFSESPMLADKVKAGTIPALKDRLPETPLVIKALGTEPGHYSDEIKVGFTGSDPSWGGFTFFAGWEALVAWSPDFNKIEMSLAENIDASPDGKVYTIHLRKGLKWSDGQPYTADDIMFYINDVMYNKDLSPSGPGADWLPGNQKEGFKAEKIDDTTVKFTFPQPYGTFLYSIAGWGGRTFLMYPKHYLMQFHKTYNDKVDDLVKADGSVTDWMGLFFKKGPDNWGNPGRWFDNLDTPSMNPWIVTQVIGTGTQIRFERNPYYWKVDAQGNQLPYFDKILGISYQDQQSRTLAMLNGDLDFIKDPQGTDRTLFYDAVAQGKPIVIKNPKSDGGNTNSIHFNQTIADPVKAEVFASKDFRIGMSYAINRKEVIDVVFAGQGTPAQVAPLEDSPLYLPGMDTQYTEYDVDKANAALDKILPTKGADGFRQSKDGKPFKIIFTVQNDLGFGTYYVQLGELLVGYWKKVGVNVVLDSEPGPQHDENKKKNKLEAEIYTGEGGAGLTGILDPRYYAPFSGAGVWNQGWSVWYTPDSTGASVTVEPPQWAKDAYAKLDAVRAEPTLDGQIAKMKIVLQEAMDRFYVIGIARPAPMYYPFNARLGGIPETWYDGWNEGTVKILSPEQWFAK